MNLPVTAWRNLWRHRRRTIITLSSIALATMLAVIMTGMQDASWRDFIDVAARMGGGHVTMQHPDYLDKPAMSRTVTGGETKTRLALEDGSVRRAVSRVTGQTLLSTARDSYGAGFIAFDPSHPRNFSGNRQSEVTQAAKQVKHFILLIEFQQFNGKIYHLTVNISIYLGKVCGQESVSDLVIRQAITKLNGNAI